MFVLVSLGSNNNPAINLPRAAALLRETFGRVSFSSIVESHAVGCGQGIYWNAVAALQVDSSVEKIQAALKVIESIVGRTADKTRVPIDLDLLAVDELVGEYAGLKLPREDILKFPFVLGPLAELCPQQRHPALKKSYCELWLEHATDFNSSPLKSVALQL